MLIKLTTIDDMNVTIDITIIYTVVYMNGQICRH